MAKDVFSVAVFLVVFREALETVIIVSVLLAFLKQTLDGPQRNLNVYKRLTRQVWLGTGIGFLICLIVGGALIGVFYTVGANRWDSNEYDYEGAFSLFATAIITVVGAALLRIGKMQEKWRVKLAAALEAPTSTTRAAGRMAWLKRFTEKYVMFALPFVTVLREGIEAIIFVAGVSFSAPAVSVPLAVVMGLIAGAAVGYLLYKSGSSAKLQVFLVASTCLLYLVAAGLFTRAIWYLETQQWNNMVGSDASELGNGPGSYDISKSVWHLNCCNPGIGGGGIWGFLNAVVGWTNSATYGSVIGYNVYWIFVMCMFATLRYKEAKGHWPLLKAKKGDAAGAEAAAEADRTSVPDSSSQQSSGAVMDSDLTSAGPEKSEDLVRGKTVEA